MLSESTRERVDLVSNIPARLEPGPRTINTGRTAGEMGINKWDSEGMAEAGREKGGILRQYSPGCLNWHVLPPMLVYVSLQR